MRARPTPVAAVAAAVVLAACSASGTRARVGSRSLPVDKVVVLMQENRSFDSYFGTLAGHGQPAAEAEPPGASNPDPTNRAGPPIPALHQTSVCEVADLDHSWTGTHAEVDAGRMDGFTAANATAADPKGSRTMGYYASSDLPYYYDLYRTFATGDRYFSSVQGPTYPNRLFLLAGTSFGHIADDVPPAGFDQPSVFNLLDQARVSWKIYFSDVPFAFVFSYVRAHARGHVFPVSQYYADAAHGDLPQVSFVDPILGGPATAANDEHPPANVQIGERFTSSVIGALMGGPDWKGSALFLTYDEHGGYFDHVAPPSAPAPDAVAPMFRPGDSPGAFDQYGVRVPVVVVSPYARPHFVSHVVNDHTSILRFIESRFGLPSLTHRDGAANPMLEFFDFGRAAFASPPSLSPAPLDPTRAGGCPGPAP